MCPDLTTARYPRQASLARQTGAGLPLAIFIITVMALLVVMMAEVQQTSGELQSLQIQQTRAFYAAETGAQAAVNKLIGPSPSGTCGASSSTLYSQAFTSSGPGLTGCSATVSCVAQSLGGNSYYTLNSVGVCGGGPDRAQRTIEVRIQ